MSRSASRSSAFFKKPYAVTIHDLSSLFFDDAHLGVPPRSPDAPSLPPRSRTRRGIIHGFRRHSPGHYDSGPRPLLTASASIYNAPDPLFLRRDETGQSEPERHRILERYQIRYPFLLYAGSIRKQKNIPRLIEAFAVVRSAALSITPNITTCASSSSETKSRAIPMSGGP